MGYVLGDAGQCP